MGVATELAWAAGFHDGEGCCYSPRRVRAKDGKVLHSVPRLQVTQAGPADEPPETLIRYLAAVGVRGTIHGPTFDINRKPRYVLVVSALDQVEAARDALWPYLSEEKRKQFEKAFNAYYEGRVDHLPKNPRKSECQRGHDLTSDDSVYVTNRRTPKGIVVERRCKTCAKDRERARYAARKTGMNAR